jgi:hypothetical protein
MLCLSSFIYLGQIAAAPPLAAANSRAANVEIPIVRKSAVEIPEQREPQQITTGDLRSLDDLITITEQGLTAQRQLREMVASYSASREIVQRNPNDNEALYRQSVMAKRLLDQIENNHLEHVFSREFLSELHLFAKVANKHILPRP